jgi:pyruvate-formate lyase-activating enzyme
VRVIHSSLYFPYIHIQVKYQGCRNGCSYCKNICQNCRCQIFKYNYNTMNGHIAINNYIIKAITIISLQMIPVSYTINRVKIQCQRISLFILFCPPYIHNIHSLSRKNDDINTLMWI